MVFKYRLNEIVGLFYSEKSQFWSGLRLYYSRFFQAQNQIISSLLRTILKVTVFLKLNVKIHTCKNTRILTQQKSPLSRAFYGWGGRIRTSGMPGPKPGALPLGDAPMRQLLYIIVTKAHCQAEN